MSVEAFIVAALVEEGTPRAAFQSGLSIDDFELYDEEFNWVCEQAERNRPINVRRFKTKFPDFEFLTVNERIADLIEEFKQERAYTLLSAAIEEISTVLAPDNAIDQAERFKEITGEILRLHTPASDVLMTSDFSEHMKRIRAKRILHGQGVPMGISTGLKNLDHHWGGLVPGRLIVVLGRPGDAKSFLNTKFFVEAFLQSKRVGMFSPEMNEDEHRSRVATLLSAKREIQKACGLNKAFRNRALLEGWGFNEKTYKKFWQYLDSLPGEMVLFTQKYRRQKMTPGFIEARIDDLGLDMVIIDPIYKLKPNQRITDTQMRLAELTDQIEDLGKMFNIPVILSNQAHRQMGNKGDAPHKDNSFGSDTPVQEGDHVIGVKYISEERKMILRCTKNRFGGDFRVDVAFYPNIGKMDDVTPIHGDYFGDDDEKEIYESLELDEMEEISQNGKVAQKD